MADVNEQVFNQTKDISLKMAKIASRTTSDIAKILLALLIEKAEKEKMEKLLDSSGEIPLKKLYEAVNKGESNLMNIKIPDEDIQQMKDLMQKNGVLYAITDLKNDNAKMVLYLDRDSEHMRDAITMFQAQKGLINEINPQLFVQNYSKENIAVMEHLSPVDLELFRHYSKQNNILYTVLPDGDDYKIAYPSEEKGKVQDALEKVSVDLTGEQGPLVRQQLEYRIKGRQQVNIAIEDAEKEYYIVNSKSPKNFVHLTANGYDYYKNNKAIVSMNRSNPDFMKGAYAAVEGLGEPIVLSADEFRLPDKDRWEILNARTSVYPVDYSIDVDKIRGASIGSPELSHMTEAREYSTKFAEKDIAVREQRSLAAQIEKAKEKAFEFNNGREVIKHHSLER